MDFCLTYDRDRQRTVAFANALKGAGLLKPNRATMTLGDGEKFTLNGFSCVDETTYRVLPADVLVEWQSRAWLDLVALHLASQRNWQLLSELHVLRTRSGSRAA
jgi:hypothetical protein